MPIIVIPTYNEKATIQRLIKKIFLLDKEIHIVVVDDSSPDDTAKSVSDLQGEYCGRLHLIVRPKKAGLASAYLEGFRFALEQGHEQIIQMDADFSHLPVHIPQFLQSLKTHDLVIGSRYLANSSIQQWPWYREYLSRSGIFFSNVLTKLNLSDPTSGYKAWRSQLLSQVILKSIESRGFSFQIEMNALAKKEGASILEIPIIFNNRTEGKSKMSASIILESLVMTIKIRSSE